MASNFTLHDTMDKALELWESVPQAAQWMLAGLGALYALRGALSVVQLLLNCFLLSGTNVRPRVICECLGNTDNGSINSSGSTARRAPGPS